MYHDIEDSSTLQIYNEISKLFDTEDSIPLIIIGEETITKYTKKSDETIIKVIEEQMDNKTNIVTEIKKGKIKKDS